MKKLKDQTTKTRKSPKMFFGFLFLKRQKQKREKKL